MAAEQPSAVYGLR